jgi:hypothetical protein
MASDSWKRRRDLHQGTARFSQREAAGADLRMVGDLPDWNPRVRQASVQPCQLIRRTLHRKVMNASRFTYRALRRVLPFQEGAATVIEDSFRPRHLSLVVQRTSEGVSHEKGAGGTVG